jgi:hypothetical protein
MDDLMTMGELGKPLPALKKRPKHPPSYLWRQIVSPRALDHGPHATQVSVTQPRSGALQDPSLVAWGPFQCSCRYFSMNALRIESRSGEMK